ncbi:MAG: hypothetical protein PF517_16860 [Salinivirgaceae bacterium]|nr:hypothetical protein [Salinivirgaceae bacterium]
MKRIIAIVAIIYVVLISCSDKTNENTTVFQNQFEYPVLKLKNVNNVLQINVQLLDTTLGLFVNEFIISTLGTSEIRAIESAAIYLMPIIVVQLMII